MKIFFQLFIFLNCSICLAKTNIVMPIDTPFLIVHDAHLTLGFSDRLSTTSNEIFTIQYFNHSNKNNDTFNYYNRLKSNSNLIAFNLGLSANFRYLGAKINFSFVPFGYRNGTQNIYLYGVIPISKGITLSPEFGYSRFRKQRRIGTIRPEDKKKIEFNKHEYDLLVIKTNQVTHSILFGLGINIDLGLDYKLYISSHYHNVFWNNTRLKVSAYTPAETFLRNADDYELYKTGNPSFNFLDASQNKAEKFYSIGNLSFIVQFCIPLEDLQGKSYNPKKFMGAQ